MNTDFRLSTNYFLNPKIIRLRQRLSEAGIVAHLRLLSWTAVHRPDGSLAELGDNDIEAAADWRGKAGKLIAALDELALLDGVVGARAVHQWAEHNAWAAEAPARRDKARWNAHFLHLRSEAEADRLVPSYAGVRKRKVAASNTASTAASNAVALATVDAPAPAPAPKDCSNQELLTSSDACASPDPIWGTGLDFLKRKGVSEKSARAFLGLSRKELRDDDLTLAELLRTAEREDVLDPQAWLSAAVRARKQTQTRVAPRSPVAGRITGKSYAETL